MVRFSAGSNAYAGQYAREAAELDPMSLLTIEVEISGGILIPKESHLLPLEGMGLLTVLTANSVPPVPRQRVALPLIRSENGEVINPSKSELDDSLWGEPG